MTSEAAAGQVVSFIELPSWMVSGDDQLTGWLVALIIFLSGVVVARVVSAVVRRGLEQRAERVVADVMARLLGYVVLAMTIVYSLDAVGVAIGPLIGALGVAGIALAFALQDLLENFVAGLMLQIRGPFNYGDEIQSNDIEGTVVAVGSRTVTVKTRDGEVVQMPSAMVIKSPIINHTTLGARRTELDVGVAYGTDLAMAIATLGRAVANTEGVLDDPAPVIEIVSFGESSIDLVARFWHLPYASDRWAVRTAVALSIDEATKATGINIPFPQRVIHRAD